MNQSYQNRTEITIRLHSAIADGGNANTRKAANKADRQGYTAVLLWYLLRWLDTSGSGRIVYPTEELAKLLGVNVRSIKRYLRDGRRLGFINRYYCDYGVVTAYYASTVNVCLRLELDDLGAITDIQLAELANAKLIATQAEMQKLQEASHNKAQRENKHKTVLEASDLLPSSQFSSGAARVIMHMGLRCVFVWSSFIRFGGSQKTVAKKMKRHRLTIQSRLSNIMREKKGMELLVRRQVAIAAPPLMKGSIQRHFCVGGNSADAFFSSTNIYEEKIELRSCRWLRSKLSRKISAQNGRLSVTSSVSDSFSGLPQEVF